MAEDAEPAVGLAEGPPAAVAEDAEPAAEPADAEPAAAPARARPAIPPAPRPLNPPLAMAQPKLLAAKEYFNPALGYKHTVMFIDNDDAGSIYVYSGTKANDLFWASADRNVDWLSECRKVARSTGQSIGKQRKNQLFRAVAAFAGKPSGRIPPRRGAMQDAGETTYYAFFPLSMDAPRQDHFIVAQAGNAGTSFNVGPDGISVVAAFGHDQFGIAM